MCHQFCTFYSITRIPIYFLWYITLGDVQIYWSVVCIAIHCMLTPKLKVNWSLRNSMTLPKWLLATLWIQSKSQIYSWFLFCCGWQWVILSKFFKNASLDCHSASKPIPKHWLNWSPVSNDTWHYDQNKNRKQKRVNIHIFRYAILQCYVWLI